jgi:hypothetical protein
MELFFRRLSHQNLYGLLWSLSEEVDFHRNVKATTIRRLRIVGGPSSHM